MIVPQYHQIYLMLLYRNTVWSCISTLYQAAFLNSLILIYRDFGLFSVFVRNYAAMSVALHISWQKYSLISLGYIHRRELVSHRLCIPSFFHGDHTPWNSVSATVYQNSIFHTFANIWVFSFIHSFIYGCVGSLSLHVGFLQLWRVGATLRCSAWASHRCAFLLWSTGSRHAGFSSCSTRAQQLWRTGLVALWHVGSSWTRDRTCVPCIDRQILNH